MKKCRLCDRPAGKKKAYCNTHNKRLERERKKAAQKKLDSAEVVHLSDVPISTNKAAVFGDLHLPWHKREAVYRALDLLTPDMNLVLQVGDIYDLYSFSRFPRSHNIMTPGEELSVARDYYCWFWGEVRYRCPGARLVQLLGNHDVRPVKRILERAPELETIANRGFLDLFESPGVELIQNDEFVWNDIAFIHGYLGRAGDHARTSNKCVVHGHSHKPGVTVLRPGLWEMDVGYLGDEKAPCFAYSAWKRAAPMTRALGLIDQLGPRVVLLP